VILEVPPLLPGEVRHPVDDGYRKLDQVFVNDPEHVPVSFVKLLLGGGGSAIADQRCSNSRPASNSHPLPDSEEDEYLAYSNFNAPGVDERYQF
jgi:hypothetical protein